MKSWKATAITVSVFGLAGVALAVGGLGAKRGHSDPRATVETCLDAAAKLRLDEVDSTLSDTGRKRIAAFTAEKFPADARDEVAVCLDVPPDRLRALQGMGFFQVVINGRDKLMVKKGVDIYKLLNVGDQGNAIREIQVGTPAIDDDQASVPLRHSNGKTSYIDLERVDGRWGISYWRRADEEPLWDPAADIPLVGMNKRSRAQEAQVNLRDFSTRAALQDRVDRITSFDRFISSYSAGRYTYFMAAGAPTGAAPPLDQGGPTARPPAGAVVLPPDVKQYPDVAKPATFAETRCPLTLAGELGPLPGLGIWAAGHGYGTDAWVFAAAGNVDGDAALDCWSISNVPRRTSSGEAVAAHVPLHEKAD
jgi:hypothetical protein